MPTKNDDEFVTHLIDAYRRRVILSNDKLLRNQWALVFID